MKEFAAIVQSQKSVNPETIILNLNHLESALEQKQDYLAAMSGRLTQKPTLSSPTTSRQLCEGCPSSDRISLSGN